jgi:hypothetical protein
MKTVYLLKNSPKSFSVLLKLVKIGDITTNIVIVDRFHAKILRKDRRVTEFPFIINTLPSFNGLIPKIAKVLPFRLYVQIMNMNMNMNMNTRRSNKKNFNKGRIITYKPQNRFMGTKITSQKSPPKLNYKCNNKKPVIKAIKQKDQSVNIILYNK